MGTISSTGVGNSNTKIIQIKDYNGTVTGTISIRKSASNSGTKKLKRLSYNFKQISSQIMMSKTSNNASKVVTKARAKVVDLMRKRKMGDYDDKELEAALIHAKKMERIARKRVKHLKAEENAKQQSTDTNQFEEEPDFYSKEEETGQYYELSEEELTQLMSSLKELMRQSMDTLLDDTGLEELTEEMTGAVKWELTPNELERLKKKHRSDELQEIAEADMKYLRALFDKLEKEKQAVSNHLSHSDLSGITLELAGTEVPVEPVSQPVMTEGGSVDCSI